MALGDRRDPVDHSFPRGHQGQVDRVREVVGVGVLVAGPALVVPTVRSIPLHTREHRTWGIPAHRDSDFFCTCLSVL